MAGERRDGEICDAAGRKIPFTAENAESAKKKKGGENELSNEMGTFLFRLFFVFPLRSLRSLR
jgi:hypothetical protein